jgi:hypothetical protein
VAGGRDVTSESRASAFEAERTGQRYDLRVFVSTDAAPSP